jgi:hypothetical protein
MKVFQKYKKKMWLHVLMDIFERMEKELTAQQPKVN